MSRFKFETTPPPPQLKLIRTPLCANYREFIADAKLVHLLSNPTYVEHINVFYIILSKTYFLTVMNPNNF